MTSKKKNKAYPNFPFLDELDIDQDVKRRLSLHLYQMYRGDNSVLVTPITKRASPEEILSSLDKVLKSGMSKLNGVLIDIEMNQRSKFGPRSIAVPWSQRKGNLEDSFKSSRTKQIDVKIRDEMRPILRPLSLQSASDYLKNDTNSGLPYYARKGKVKQKALDEFDKLISSEYPCILFTRTQEQKKTRNVWGYPIADTLNEMRYYFPLLSYQKKLSYRSALLGPNKVDESLTKLILKARDNGLSIISIDFSAYDTSVKSNLQYNAFKYIKSLFQNEYAKDIDYIARRFNTISIVTPSGIIRGSHGVPSGSTFTNEVDSIVQYMLAMSKPYVLPDLIQIQGDDGAYAIPEDQIDDFYDVFRNVGLNVNEDKSYVSKDYCVYLQNLHHVDYMKNGVIGGIYPIYRALNRIIYQERWSRFEDEGILGKDYYSIRTISILENCKHHPLFEDFVKLVYKYDKYSLGFSDHGLAKYIKFTNQTEGLGGILENQYGDDVRGIKSFEAYKIIKGMS